MADAILDDSLAVCGNPIRDPGWVFETRKGHEGDNPYATLNPRSDDDRSGNGLRENALQAVQVRLEPGTSEGAEILFCLLDRQPVFKNITRCNQYKPDPYSGKA